MKMWSQDPRPAAALIWEAGTKYRWAHILDKRSSNKSCGILRSVRRQGCFAATSLWTRLLFANPEFSCCSRTLATGFLFAPQTSTGAGRRISQPVGGAHAPRDA
ncbi:hypothetical protein B0T16DRAFT_15529 [Cercophora newfieldiana]|uniref:Uncharacterized protein n=1 Tax=Cercophora newfieldiana TaxID=92897 RepID=A0AA39YND2_9PEZI|nr:hypothetical protein B0T16DRAFT_15529 [Cercophora newfieldiana]